MLLSVAVKMSAYGPPKPWEIGKFFTLLIIFQGILYSPLCTRADDEGKNHFLLDKSFRISSIMDIRNDGKPDVLTMVERYSILQLRSVLKSQDRTGETRLDFYEAGRSEAIRLHIPTSGFNEPYCSRVAPTDFAMTFSEEWKRYLVNSGKEWRHVAHVNGPSGLIFLIASRIKDLKKHSTDSSSSMKEMLNYGYYLELESPDGIVRIWVSYRAAKTAALPLEEIVLGSIPSEISIKMPNHSGVDIKIRFLSHQILDDTYEHTGLEDVSAMSVGSGAAIDMFSLPLRPGCSDLVTQTDSTYWQMFKEHDPEVHISFSARSELIRDQDARKMFYFVAHNSIAGATRFDTMDEARSTIETSIYDQRRRQRYTILTDNHGQNSICMAFQAQLLKDKAFINLEASLLGSDDYKYMGRGRVRDIDATIHQATSNKLPTWLTDIVPYEASDGSIKLKVGPLLDDVKATSTKSPRYLYTLYLSNDEHYSNVMVPLLLEIKDHSNPKSSHIIEIYNFQWTLAESPNGHQPHELFVTPSKDCLDANARILAESQDVGHIELQIMAELNPKSGPGSLEWIHDWRLRNVALQDVLDRFTWQDDVALDLNSRVLQDGATMNVILEFILKARLPKTYRIKFLGHGKPVEAFEEAAGTPDSYKMAHQRFGKQSSLMDCALRAGDQMKINKPIYLYFNEQDGECVMDLGLHSRFTETHNSDDFEIFLLQPNVENRNPFATWLTEEGIKDDLGKYRTFELVDRQRRSYSRTEPHRNFDFIVTKVKAQNDNTLHALRTDESSKKRGPRPVIYDKMTLPEPETDPRVSRIKWNGQTKEDSDHQISLVECELACHNEAQCNSFSYCVKNSRSICLTSTVDLSSQDVIRQILSIENKPNHRRGDKFDVELGSSEKAISMVWMPTCQTQRRSYVRMFSRTGSAQMVDTATMDVSVAKDLDECAGRCFKRTVDTYSQGITNSPQHEAILSGAYDGLEDDKQYKTIKKHLKEVFSTICTKLFYLNTLDKDAINHFSKLPGFEQISSEHNSVCLLPRPDSVRESKHMGFMVSADSYHFEYSNLFQAQPHFKLAKTSTDAEDEALAKFKSMLSPDALKTIKTAIDEGHNFQTVKGGFRIDAMSCANFCFLQNFDGLPCASFDVAISQNSTICYLNSMALRTGDGSQLSKIEREEDIPELEDCKLVHYEPKFSAMQLITKEVTAVELLSLQDNLEYHLSKSLGLIMFLIVIVGAASGICLSMWVTDRLKPWPRTTESDLTVILPPDLNSL